MQRQKESERSVPYQSEPAERDPEMNSEEI